MQAFSPKRTPFGQLLSRFRAGDPAATEELLRRYTPVLREVVRRRLPARMRGEYESLDFVQEVWTAMCATPCPPDLDTPEQLKGYLVNTAMNRVVDALRHRSTQKCWSGSQDHAADERTAGAEPTPSQWVMAEERWEAIAAELNEGELRVVDRLRQGFTQAEIATMTGVSLRTINRLVTHLRRECGNASA